MKRELSKETWELLDAIIHELMDHHAAAEEAVKKMLLEDYGVDWEAVERQLDKAKDVIPFPSTEDRG